MRSAAPCNRNPTSCLADWKTAVRTRSSSSWTATPWGSAAWKRAINCLISWSWARRSWGGSGSFFIGGQFGPGFFDDLLGVLLGELLELLIARQRLAHGGHLVAGHVAVEVPAFLPALQVVIRTGGTLAHDAEFAPFHGLDLGDLLEKFLGY